jgi:hypothetical protein
LSDASATGPNRREKSAAAASFVSLIGVEALIAPDHPASALPYPPPKPELHRQLAEAIKVAPRHCRHPNNLCATPTVLIKNESRESPMPPLNPPVGPPP